jgi:hypothetical protein
MKRSHIFVLVILAALFMLATREAAHAGGPAEDVGFSPIEYQAGLINEGPLATIIIGGIIASAGGAVGGPIGLVVIIVGVVVIGSGLVDLLPTVDDFLGTIFGTP